MENAKRFIQIRVRRCCNDTVANITLVVTICCLRSSTRSGITAFNKLSHSAIG